MTEAIKSAVDELRTNCNRKSADLFMACRAWVQLRNSLKRNGGV